MTNPESVLFHMLWAIFKFLQWTDRLISGKTFKHLNAFRPHLGGGRGESVSSAYHRRECMSPDDHIFCSRADFYPFFCKFGIVFEKDFFTTLIDHSYAPDHLAIGGQHSLISTGGNARDQVMILHFVFIIEKLILAFRKKEGFSQPGLKESSTFQKYHIFRRQFSRSKNVLREAFCCCNILPSAHERLSVQRGNPQRDYHPNKCASSLLGTHRRPECRWLLRKTCSEAIHTFLSRHYCITYRSSLATRLCYDFTLLYIEACTYTR